MSDPRFEFFPEPDEHILRITMRGLWPPVVIQTYQAERDIKIKEMIVAGCPLDRMLILVDARNLSVQSQEAVAMFRELLGTSPLQPLRSAMVLSSALLRMQIKRISMPRQSIFSSLDAAESWLLSTLDLSS